MLIVTAIRPDPWAGLVPTGKIRVVQLAARVPVPTPAEPHGAYMPSGLHLAGFFAAWLTATAVWSQPVPPHPRERDWAGLRGDVEAEARRPHSREGAGNFELRRRMIRDRAQARYTAADVNRDGLLSRDELARLHPGLTADFERHDRDGDGLISRRELFEAARERRRSGGGPAGEGAGAARWERQGMGEN